MIRSIRRYLCQLFDCHAICPQDDEHPPRTLPPELIEKEQRYREASHEMRNAVMELQGAARRVTTAFDELARRWE